MMNLSYSWQSVRAILCVWGGHIIHLFTVIFKQGFADPTFNIGSPPSV